MALAGVSTTVEIHWRMLSQDYLLPASPPYLLNSF